MLGKSKNGLIGIDVGSRVVKLAQIARDFDGVRVVQAISIPRRRPWQDARHGRLAPADGSFDEINAAFRSPNAFSGKQSACALPMHLYDFTGVRLPHGADDERRTMIASELDARFREFGDDCEFDFWSSEMRGAPSRADEPNVNVLALGQSWARRIARDIHAARLRCQAIDGPPLAMARAVGLVDQSHERSPVAAVDWGYTNTTFTIIAAGIPVYVRRIRGCGARHVLAAIQDSLEITEDQTQFLLDANGLSDMSPASTQDDELATVLTQRAAEPIRKLTTQLNRTLDYFRAQRKSLIPSKIWMLGGGACIGKIDRVIEAQVRLPVSIWRLRDSTQLNSGVTDATTPLFATAVGLSALPFAA